MEAKAVKFEMIEVIRGIGCLVISLFHIFSKDGDYALKGLPQGIQTLYHLSHFAMAVFFLLSGFVIGKILFQEKTIGCFNFFIQRFARIYLLYWVFFFISLALFFILPQYYHYWSLTPENFIQDFLLIPNKYFGNDRFSLLFVSWTLTYEIYFYLLATISLMFKRRILRFAILTTLLILPSFLHSQHLIDAHFLASNNLILIAIGVIASYTTPRELVGVLKKYGPWSFMDYAIAGLLAVFLKPIIISIFLYLHYLFSDSETAIVSLMAVFLFIIQKEYTFKNILWRSLLNIGQRSYSFYLSHTLVIMIVTQLLISLNITLHRSLFTLLVLSSLILFAWLTYHWIEKPLELFRKTKLSQF